LGVVEWTNISTIAQALRKWGHNGKTNIVTEAKVLEIKNVEIF